MSRSLKMSRKRLAFPIAVALAVLAICIPAANAKPQASTVTLSGIFTSEHQSSLAPLVANFERVYPNIHLNFTYIPNATYQSVLLTDIQGGNMPDLVETQAGASSSYAVFALASQGKFADLTGSPWGKRVPPKYFKYIQVKRHTYAFPMGYSLAGLIYNVDMLHQLGLSLPTTFADLVAMCPKVSAAGKVTIASPWAVPTGPIDMMAAIEPNFVYNLDPNWTLERIQHKVTFASSPLWQRRCASSPSCATQTATSRIPRPPERRRHKGCSRTGKRCSTLARRRRSPSRSSSTRPPTSPRHRSRPTRPAIRRPATRRTRRWSRRRPTVPTCPRRRRSSLSSRARRRTSCMPRSRVS